MFGAEDNREESYRQILLKRQKKGCPSEENLTDFAVNYGLTDKERMEIQKHIEQCSLCSKKVEAERYFYLLPDELRIEPPEGYLDRLLEHLRNTPRKIQCQ